jgi:hypothetical protein
MTKSVIPAKAGILASRSEPILHETLAFAE